MSRSENIYNAEDSDADADSFSDELSPTDGYFNRGNVPTNMVHDPSADMKTEGKVLIPTPTASNTGGTSRTSLDAVLPRSLPSHTYASPHHSIDNARSPPTHSPVSPIVSRRGEAMFRERRSSINGPPPAYSPSESPIVNPVPPTSQSPLLADDPGRSYSTFPEHHLERGYLPSREPESMGAPPPEPDESTPLASTPRKPSRRRVIIRKLLFIALVFASITALLAAMFAGSHDHNNDENTDPIGDGPSEDRPVDQTGPYCAAAKHHVDSVVYEFSQDNDFSIFQAEYGDNGSHQQKIRTAGEVRLRRIPKNSDHGNKPYFTVEIHVSDPSLEVFQIWNKDDQYLTITTPSYAQLDTRGPHCVSVEVTAWIPEDAKFANIKLQSISLSIRVLDDLKINVLGRSNFASISGRMYFPNFDLKSLATSDFAESGATNLNSFKHPFDSRRTIVETISGAITGCYPLLDDLILSSQSGPIRVSVVPGEALPSAPKPADLEVQTSSGSIRVDCPLGLNSKYDPPLRDYITRVHSNSGSMDGTYYFGSQTSFKGTSSSIQITGLPIIQSSSGSSINDRPKHYLETRTLSGSTKIEIADPIFFSPANSFGQQKPDGDKYTPIGDDDPYLILPPSSAESNPSYVRNTNSEQKLNNLFSTHASSSATVEVYYPGVWEGFMHAKTVSGGITSNGKGLRIVKQRNGPGFKELLVKKGVDDEKDGSSVDMSDIAGGLSFNVGSRLGL